MEIQTIRITERIVTGQYQHVEGEVIASLPENTPVEALADHVLELREQLRSGLLPNTKKVGNGVSHF